MPPGRSAQIGVACRGVAVTYSRRDVFGRRRSTRILENVTFVAHPGRLTGILGPSGSGKTTITNLINDRVSAKVGTVTPLDTPRSGSCCWELVFLR